MVYDWAALGSEGSSAGTELEDTLQCKDEIFYTLINRFIHVCRYM